VSQFDGFFGVVGDAQRNQHIRPAHDAQPDFAVAHRHFGYFGQGIVIGFHDVIQKMNGQVHHFAKPFPVDLAVLNHFAEIDGSEIARFIRQERLLSAGVGGFDFSDMGCRIVPVEPVEKNNARLSVFPCLRDNPVENLAGVEGS